MSDHDPSIFNLDLLLQFLRHIIQRITSEDVLYFMSLEMLQSTCLYTLFMTIVQISKARFEVWSQSISFQSRCMLTTFNAYHTMHYFQYLCKLKNM